MQHCCEYMTDALLEKKIYVGYGPRYREYFIYDKSGFNNGYLLWHCPWCAKKLPSSVRDQWFEVLEKEYNLDDPWSDEQEKLVPKEFTTDEWWKKRGL